MSHSRHRSGINCHFRQKSCRGKEHLSHHFPNRKLHLQNHKNKFTFSYILVTFNENKFKIILLPLPAPVGLPYQVATAGKKPTLLSVAFTFTVGCMQRHKSFETAKISNKILMKRL